MSWHNSSQRTAGSAADNGGQAASDPAVLSKVKLVWLVLVTHLWCLLTVAAKVSELTEVRRLTFSRRTASEQRRTGCLQKGTDKNTTILSIRHLSPKVLALLTSWSCPFRVFFKGFIKSNVFCTVYPVAWVFYSTIPCSSVALESSGSISASATAVIFQSQTVLFYSLGTHFAFSHFVYGTQTPKNLQRLRLLDWWGQLMILPRQRMYQTKLPL